MKEQSEVYWPTATWRTLSPQTIGLQAEDFAPLRQAAQEDERVHSLLVVRSGYIVFEEYYHGWSQNHYHNINSITKNVTSTLVGIALREHKIAALDQSIFAYFPEYAALGEQENRKAIQLRHLLSLTSGYTPRASIATFLEDTATLEKMLARPVSHEPGQVFSYDDIDIHLISYILARVTGIAFADFAQQYLFAPLGIWRDEQGQLYPWKHGTAIADQPHPYGLWNAQSDRLWSVDRQGNEIGSYGLQLTTRELAKLGYLYLHQGMWDGQQIIPAEYVEASLRSYSTTSRGSEYGYSWYIIPFRGQPSFWGIGFGGQLLACFPNLDLIFAMTAHPAEDRPPAHVTIMNEAFGPLLEKIVKRQV